jgi:prevent-host-death family protein
MKRVNLADAKARLSELVTRAAAGEPICIMRRGKPVAQLTAVDVRRKRIDPSALQAITDKMPLQLESAGEFVRRMRLMLYLDTSVLVALLTNEAKTRRVQVWLGQQDPDDLVITDWVVAEFSAALSIKLRTGGIEVDHRAEALAMFTRLCNANLTVLPVSRLQFHMAARFADQYGLGLRAGDALHLAVCAEHGAPCVHSTGASAMRRRHWGSKRRSCECVSCPG